MKIWYFENTYRDKSNEILYDIIYLCILVEKYGQSKLGQNYTFSNGSSIAGRREHHVEFIRRQANMVAHELAKTSTFIPSFRIFDEIPTCIIDLLIFNEMI